MSEELDKAPNGVTTKPPYVPFQTLKNFLKMLSENGIPGRIDNSLMANLSGGMQSQLTLAMRYLGLVGPKGEIDDGLRKLVAAVNDDEQWKLALQQVVLPRLQRIVEGVDLKTATARELSDAFSETGGATGSVNAKATRFFLRTLEDCHIGYSKHFKGIGRATATTRRKRKTPSLDSARGENGVENPEMVSFPVHLPGKAPGKIELPRDFDSSDVAMVDAVVNTIKVYAENQTGKVVADDKS